VSPVDPEPIAAATGLPRVSVIVPIYNVASTLPITLPSWLIQEHAELLLVDDGSTDGSRAYLDTWALNQPSVRILEHDQNRGRAAARNTGIAAATGDVLLFLDADMRPEPDFVRQHAMLHQNADVIGVVSRPVLEGLNESDYYHDYLRSRIRAVRREQDAPLPFKFFIIGYTSVKAHAAREVGGFNERFTYGEDLDFAYRLATRYPNRLIRSDKPKVHHYDHGTLDERLRKLHEFGRDNLPLLLTEHPGLGRMANLDFVDSDAPSTLAGRVKHWGLRPSGVGFIRASIRALLPYVPSAMRPLLLRYVMASTVADAYRQATPFRPH
jgi:glycosyltransferase involved in cell wall biosynthesis